MRTDELIEWVSRRSKFEGVLRAKRPGAGDWL
jgi:hypothetical protein